MNHISGLSNERKTFRCCLFRFSLKQVNQTGNIRSFKKNMQCIYMQCIDGGGSLVVSPRLFRNFFELVRFDFILDDQLKAWLLEVC